ncbi:MAG: ribonuclease E/G [Pseudomonadota bacterium]
MTGRQIVLDHLGGRAAAALVVDGRLEDLLVDPGTDLAQGAILRGTVDRVIKGGAFVRLPGGQGFLRGAGGYRSGRMVLVQIGGFADPGKAVPVTERLIFKGRTVIVTPGAAGINLSRQVRDGDTRDRLLNAVGTKAAVESPHGIVVRTAAVAAKDAEIAREVDEILMQADDVLAAVTGEPAILRRAPDAHALAKREWATSGDTFVVEAGGFETHDLMDAIASLRSPDVPLSPGSLFIEPTHALIAVDVNTGGDFSPAAGLKTNIAAARELPRQLRLRGYGGQIVVDFAPMPKKDRRRLEEALKSAFRTDPVETALVGWTSLGLYEIQRKRERRPLHEVLK